jgi:hypothetical protein
MPRREACKAQAAQKDGRGQIAPIAFGGCSSADALRAYEHAGSSELLLTCSLLRPPGSLSDNMLF